MATQVATTEVTSQAESRHPHTPDVAICDRGSRRPRTRNQATRPGDVDAALKKLRITPYPEHVIDAHMRQMEMTQSGRTEYQRRLVTGVAIAICGAALFAAALLSPAFSDSWAAAGLCCVLGVCVVSYGLNRMPSHPPSWIEWTFEGWLRRNRVPDSVHTMYARLQPLLPDAQFFVLQWGTDPIFGIRIGTKRYYLWAWEEPGLAPLLFGRKAA